MDAMETRDTDDDRRQIMVIRRVVRLRGWRLRLVLVALFLATVGM